MKIPLYRIVDWDRYYENNRSRIIKKLNWVRIRTSFQGNKIKPLIVLGGAEAYGVWITLPLIASTCDPRGTLVTSTRHPSVTTTSPERHHDVTKVRVPHTPFSLSMKSGIPTSLYETWLPLFVKLGLLEIAEEVEVVIPDIVPLTRHNDVNRGEERRIEQQQHTSDVVPHLGDIPALAPTAAAVVVNPNEEEGKPTLSDVCRELRLLGVDGRVSTQICQAHPYDRVMGVIEMVKAKGADARNRAGMVVVALNEGWDVPPIGSKKEDPNVVAERMYQQERAKHEAEYKQILEDRQTCLDTLAKLPPAQFERLAGQAFQAIPPGLRTNIDEENDDPIENNHWRAQMWLLHQRGLASPLSDEDEKVGQGSLLN